MSRALLLLLPLLPLISGSSRGGLRRLRVGREVDAQTLQQVRGRSGQSRLAAEGLQQVCDQIQVYIQRLDLLLRLP